MKFTDFEVTRVGRIVVLDCYCDTPAPGVKVQVSVALKDDAEQQMYEELLIRLARCAAIYQDVPDDAIEGTVALMKGKP